MFNIMFYKILLSQMGMYVGINYAKRFNKITNSFILLKICLQIMWSNSFIYMIVHSFYFVETKNLAD